MLDIALKLTFISDNVVSSLEFTVLKTKSRFNDVSSSNSTNIVMKMYVEIDMDMDRAMDMNLNIYINMYV